MLGGIATFAVVAYAFTQPAPTGLPIPPAAPEIMSQAVTDIVAPEPPLPTIIPLAKPAQLAVTLTAPVDALPASEMQCLTEAVYYESRGEPIEGQRAVAEVIVRRSHDRRYPKTICGVVYQDAHKKSCQFSFACDGPRPHRHDALAWKEAADVAAYEITGPGAHEDVTRGATHFHALHVSPGWSRDFARTVQIGNHIFYRQPGPSYQAQDLRGATS